MTGLVEPAGHSDDMAVDRFSAAMKAKLKWEREVRGRHGWDDPSVCSPQFLARLLVEHLSKGNAGTFEDVANFAMMLHQIGADPSVLAEAAEAEVSKLKAQVETASVALQPFAKAKVTSIGVENGYWVVKLHDNQHQPQFAHYSAARSVLRALSGEVNHG